MIKKQNTLFAGVKVKEPQKKEKVLNKVNKIKNPKSGSKQVVLKSLEDIYNSMDSYTERILKKLPDYSFSLVTSTEELFNYLDAIKENVYVGFDTETTGLDPLSDKVVGFSLYTKGKEAIYVPCGHFNYDKNVDVKDFLTKLTQLSKNGVKVSMANAIFDQRSVKNSFGFDNYMNCFWDVLLAGKFLNENDKEHNLKFLWEKYIVGTPEKDIEADNYQKLFGNRNFGELDPEKVYLYAAVDAIITEQLREFQMQFLHEDGIYNVENDFVDTAPTFAMWNKLNEAVASMIDTGIHSDKDKLENSLNTFNAQLQDLRLQFDSYVDNIAEQYLTPLKNNDPELFSKIDFPLNPASSSQLAILFYDAMGFKRVNKRSTDVNTLEMLAKEYPEHKRMFNLITEFRNISKLKSTYTVGLSDSIHEVTDKIHAQFKPYGAVTGRFSCVKPNLQNIPVRTEIGRAVRRMFIPPEGYYLIGSDFSQQEPRILASLSQDETMIQAYKDGRDLYAETASRVFKVPYEECLESFGPEGKKRRNATKALVLGIMYGRGANSIADTLEISIGAAKSIISKFYQGFPKVKEFVDTQKELCLNRGYVKTAWGRKRRIPELRLSPYEISGKSSNPDILTELTNRLDGLWDFKEKRRIIRTYEKTYGIKIKDNNGIIAHAGRQVVNSIIQGTASDMINESIVAIYNDEEFNSLGGKIVITVHDEILGIAPKETAVRALKRMEQLMIACGSKYIDVPMKCDGEILERWSGKNIRQELENGTR